MAAKAIADFEGSQRQYAGSGEYALIVCVATNQACTLVTVAVDSPEQRFNERENRPNERQNPLWRHRGSNAIDRRGAGNDSAHYVGSRRGQDEYLCRRI